MIQSSSALHVQGAGSGQVLMQLESCLAMRRGPSCMGKVRNDRDDERKRKKEAPGKALCVGNHSASAQMDNVVAVAALTYAHAPDAPPSLSHINLDLPPGSRTLLVGANGGKPFFHSLPPNIYPSAPFQPESPLSCRSSLENVSSQPLALASLSRAMMSFATPLLASLSSAQNGLSMSPVSSHRF